MSRHWRDFPNNVIDRKVFEELLLDIFLNGLCRLDRFLVDRHGRNLHCTYVLHAADVKNEESVYFRWTSKSYVYLLCLRVINATSHAISGRMIIIRFVFSRTFLLRSYYTTTVPPYFPRGSRRINSYVFQILAVILSPGLTLLRLSTILKLVPLLEAIQRYRK